MTSHDQDRIVSAAAEPLPGIDSTPPPAGGRAQKATRGGAHRAPSSAPWHRRNKAAEAAAAEATPAVQRPTPYKRAQPGTTAALPAMAPADAVAVVAAVAGASRRRPPSIRLRPALYLAAVLVAAMGVTVVSAGEPSARAVTPASHSVNIAERLGVKGLPSTVTTEDAARLGELAASRNERGAEQAAAAHLQAVANRTAVEAARPKCVLPVKGARLTSGFGMRWGVLHAGIDLAAPMGTPEYAAMDGVVLRAGPASGFGLAVYIQHANGDVTVYGHMEKILVTDGQVVRAGQTIALLGENGQATGPHLHFEVHVGGMMGQKIDPIPWLRARGVTV